MKNKKQIINIMEALANHEDQSSLEVLVRIGTDSEVDEVRRLTSKALVERNTRESLSIVILEKGKGINDLSTSVAMSTINELLLLKDKREAMEVLSSTAETHSDEEVRETAHSVQSLMAFS